MSTPPYAVASEAGPPSLCELIGKVVRTLTPEESIATFQGMTITELKEYCKEFKLKVAGSKADLASRLDAHLRQQAPPQQIPSLKRWRSGVLKPHASGHRRRWRSGVLQPPMSQWKRIEGLINKLGDKDIDEVIRYLQQCLPGCIVSDDGNDVDVDLSNATLMDQQRLAKYLERIAQ